MTASDQVKQTPSCSGGHRPPLQLHHLDVRSGIYSTAGGAGMMGVRGWIFSHSHDQRSYFWLVFLASLLESFFAFLACFFALAACCFSSLVCFWAAAFPLLVPVVPWAKAGIESVNAIRAAKTNVVNLFMVFSP